MPLQESSSKAKQFTMKVRICIQILISPNRFLTITVSKSAYNKLTINIKTIKLIYVNYKTTLVYI